MACLLPALEEQGYRPRIYCGSSAGSINSVLLAGLAHLPAGRAAEQLSSEWDRLLGPMIRSVGLAWPVTALRYLAGRLHLPVPAASWLDPAAVRSVLGRWDGWDVLHRNIEDGHVDAVALTSTDLTGDRTVVHVETRPEVELPPDDEDRGVVYRRTRLGLEHVYASSCIPFISPPVDLPDEAGKPSWNVDGGVRQNVPLKPALDLGAERLVVVATDVTSRPQASTAGGVPTTLDLADQLLHLATGDRLLEDLRTLTTVNTLLAASNDHPTTREGRPYRRVPALVVAPEGPDDIGNLVGEALSAGPLGVLSPLADLLTAVTGVPGKSTPDLVSFLLFLSAFTRRAVDLGERRAEQVLGRRGGPWSEAPPNLTGIR